VTTASAVSGELGGGSELHRCHFISTPGYLQGNNHIAARGPRQSLPRNCSLQILAIMQFIKHTEMQLSVFIRAAQA
ncbi:MAG: hypothetical protein ABGY43_14475, partial [bacterium]